MGPDAPATRRSGAAQRARSRPSRRTVRARLALAYLGAFLLSGAALLIVTVGIWQGRSLSSVSAARSGGALQLPVSSVPQGPQAAQQSSDLHQLVISAAIAFGLMAALSVALGWTAAGRFLRPIRTITTATRQISATNLHERLNLAGPEDELKELGDTFDELLERLEKSFQAERLFVANASHELRTPLAIMRASLDVAMAKPGPQPPQMATLSARLRRELDHVDELLESLLALAQAQQGPVAEMGVVPLDAVVSLAIERRAETISCMRLRVEQRGSPAALTRGSETLLARLVDNLVDNAVKHNEPGGYVHVRTDTDGIVARLVVENGGPALSPRDVEDLVRPFRRLGAERTRSDNGSGLGLSIVKSIAEVHGGVLDLSARPGGGLRAAVTLPLAAWPPSLSPLARGALVGAAR
jgi:signal transduction histidine kinase